MTTTPKTDQQPVCACCEPGQDRDGWVRYQARDGEFITLRCRSHEDGNR